MAVNWNKLALIHKTERAEALAKAEDMNGGLTFTAMNYTKKNEPKYRLKVSGSKPEFYTYNSRVAALKALEAKIK